MKSPPTTVRVCALSDIPDGDSCTLVIPLTNAPSNIPSDAQSARPVQEKRSVIAVRQAQAVWLYANACPHVGAPLDLEPGQFLNFDKTLILCAMHGSLFTIDEGVCIHGPCTGKALDKIPCRVERGEVYIKLE